MRIRWIGRALASVVIVGLAVTTAAAGASAASGGMPDAAAIKPISWWESLYLDELDYDNSVYEPLSKSADSWDHYNLAYGLDDPVALYLATGKTRYLDQAVGRADAMVATAKPSTSLGSEAYGDSYKGWISKKNGETGQEVPLYESYAWRYVTRMLRVIRQTPALYGNTHYKAEYDKLLAFAEVNIFDKWYSRGVDDNIYRSHTHLAAHWAYIAMNLTFMTTNAARLAREREVLENIDYHLPNYGGASLHGQLVPSPVADGAYFWNWEWNSTARPGSDVSHGNNVVAYIVEAHDLGVDEWSDQDVEALAVTFDKVLWPARHTYREWLDGTGTDTGWFTDGWMKLGRYDVAIQQRLETANAAHEIAGSHGNGALNAKLLGATA
jgi:hypothetical protein